jgi:hypothetical protein
MSHCNVELSANVSYLRARFFRGLDHVPDHQTCVHDRGTVSVAFLTAVKFVFKLSLAFKNPC